MLLLRTRRPGARTISSVQAHQINWRAANDGDEHDDGLAAARVLWDGFVLGTTVWTVLAIFTWWVIALLAGDPSVL